RFDGWRVGRRPIVVRDNGGGNVERRPVADQLAVSAKAPGSLDLRRDVDGDTLVLEARGDHRRGGQPRPWLGARWRWSVLGGGRPVGGERGLSRVTHTA